MSKIFLAPPFKTNGGKKFARDASRTCRTRDLKSSLRDAFLLNESRNETSRQTLVTEFSFELLEVRQILHLAITSTGDKSRASLGKTLISPFIISKIGQVGRGCENGR